MMGQTWTTGFAIPLTAFLSEYGAHESMMVYVNPVEAAR